jgi:hypothetical protein
VSYDCNDDDCDDDYDDDDGDDDDTFICCFWLIRLLLDSSNLFET